MAFSLFIVPEIFIPDTEGGRRLPKYFRGPNGGVIYSHTAMPYGFQPIFMVAADLTDAERASVSDNPDVTAFPIDLTGTVGAGNLQTARNILEQVFIPAQGISGSDTWQTVARMCAGMFQYMTRLYVILGPVVVIDSSTKLNAQWASLPEAIQNAVLQAATSLGYDLSFIQNQTQVRAILKNFADQWGDDPFDMGGFIF